VSRFRSTRRASVIGERYFADVVLVLALSVFCVWPLSTGAEVDPGSENPLIIKVDPLTGLPLTIRGRASPLLVLGHIDQWDRTRITGLGPLLVKKYEALLKIAPEALRLKGADRIDGTWYVSYWQTHRGLIVYESSLGFSIDPQGQVASLGALLYPGIRVPEKPKINRAKALAIAERQIPEFKKKDYRLMAENIIIYPDRKADRLDYYRVYAFNFFPRKALHPASAIGGWAAFVDCQTGKVIQRQPLFKPMGCCIPENWTPPKVEDVYKGVFGN
jgi:hypothetical protein